MPNGNGKGRGRPEIKPTIASEQYKGYTILDKGDCYYVLHGTDFIGGANLIDEAKALADADIEKRKAANAKKMGRHENNPDDLI